MRGVFGAGNHRPGRKQPRHRAYGTAGGEAYFATGENAIILTCRRRTSQAHRADWFEILLNGLWG